jgi:hypothetical protein
MAGTDIASFDLEDFWRALRHTFGIDVGADPLESFRDQSLC